MPHGAGSLHQAGVPSSATPAVSGRFDLSQVEFATEPGLRGPGFGDGCGVQLFLVGVAIVHLNGEIVECIGKVGIGSGEALLGRDQRIEQLAFEQARVHGLPFDGEQSELGLSGDLHPAGFAALQGRPVDAELPGDFFQGASFLAEAAVFSGGHTA